MRGTDAMAALAELMPVIDGVDERVDRGEVEAAWGTRFPSDCVRFMKVYGSGVISDGISILLPALQADGYPYTAGPGLQDETEIARETWEMCRDAAAFDADLESIVAWGVTSGADIYCWVTAYDDPDRWPVLICGRHTNPEMQFCTPSGWPSSFTVPSGDAAGRVGFWRVHVLSRTMCSRPLGVPWSGEIRSKATSSSSCRPEIDVSPYAGYFDSRSNSPTTLTWSPGHRSARLGGRVRPCRRFSGLRDTGTVGALRAEDLIV
ncbi:SMI1/KNR4 family protein [Streptomyces avidinii]|uniref:hypothetical protein n=1 Tax=Streptomyces avidinii TaxID=1895 RepID=UPI00386862B2|nr:SMI1/KNR4 family protein [Streptomyces avidinii]